MGNISPNSSDVSYNPASGEISWNIGKIKAGTGYETEPIELAFQIGITPGFSHIGKTPAFISDGNFEGKDTFTSVSLNQRIASYMGYFSENTSLMDGFTVQE